MRDLVICEFCGRSFYTSNNVEVCASCMNAKAPKTTKTEKHQDAHLNLSDLKAKVSRLVASTKINIERNADKDVSLCIEVVSQAEVLFRKKATKAELLNLITLNSEASRQLNNQK
jgi:uncharacterized UBP type Zn finger protein